MITLTFSFNSGLNPKNITAIANTLILINNIADYLKASWKYVFEFLTLLDDLQTSANCLEKGGVESPIDDKESKQYLMHIEYELVDKLIENTKLLSEKSLIIMIENLLYVSK